MNEARVLHSHTLVSQRRDFRFETHWVWTVLEYWIFTTTFFALNCTKIFYFAPKSGAKYCDERVRMYVCLSLCSLAYLKNDTSELHEFFVHVTCGRVSDFFWRYALPVLWMTSCSPIIGRAKVTLIGRKLKVTHQGAEPGLKSDVYDCLVRTACRPGNNNNNTWYDRIRNV